MHVMALSAVGQYVPLLHGSMEFPFAPSSITRGSGDSARIIGPVKGYFNFGLNTRIFNGGLRRAFWYGNYHLPVYRTSKDKVYLHVHAEYRPSREGRYREFPGDPGVDIYPRWDVALGGGYRTFLTENTVVGFTVFEDTVFLPDSQFASMSMGLEAAWRFAPNSVVDVGVITFGRDFDYDSGSNVSSAFWGNLGLELGYSFRFFDIADVRLKTRVYELAKGMRDRGITYGLELSGLQGLGSISFEHVKDPVLGDDTQISAALGLKFNLGFDISDVGPFSFVDSSTISTLHRLFKYRGRSHWPASLLGERIR